MWTGTFTLVDDNEEATGTYQISGFQDLAFNTMNADSTNTVDVDTAAPTISVGTIAGDNSYVDVVFTEEVYGDSSASLPIDITDFIRIFSRNGGAQLGISFNSITKTTGGSLTGGETQVRIHMTVSGTPTGAETIEIKPASGSSIYDLNGNAASGLTTTGPVVLNFVLSSSNSRLPRDSNNWLSNTDLAGNGDLDGINVIFFEVPDTVSSTLYFAVNDPGTDGAWPDAGTLTTNFYLIGGSGTLSDSNSRKIDYSGIESQSRTGTILDTITRGNVADNWVYFSGVSPSQGEHIGNKYFFKIVADVGSGGSGSKNGYQVDISYSNSGTPDGISGVSTFAYDWCVVFLDSGTWDIYPFVPDGAAGSIIYHTWDFDSQESGTAYDKSGTNKGAITVSANNAEATDSYVIGTELNGTWRLHIDEDNSSPGFVNTSEIWFSDSVTGEFYRAYSAQYTPPQPDHVTLSFSDGVAISDGIDTESITLQIVGADGTPLQYSRKVYVQISGNAKIKFINGVDQGASPPAAAYVTTDGNGIATIKVIDSSTELVSVTVTTNGNTAPGTAVDEVDLPGTNDSVNIDFQTNPVPLISSASNKTFNKGDPSTVLPQITLTDSPIGANFTTANDIRIRVPSALDAAFNTGITATLTFGGTASLKVNGTVSYPDNWTVLVQVTTTFSPGDTLTIDGLELQSFN
jgi:hypothetical protein